MKYYNVKSRGTFYMEIEECENIANLTDSFATEDQLKELCDTSDWQWNTKVYFVHKIKAVIEDWITLIPPNALSTTLTTRDASIMLNEINTDRLRRYAPTGYSIKGRRLYNVINYDNRENEKLESIAEKEKVHRQMLEDAPYEREQRPVSHDSYSLESAIRKAIQTKYNITISHHGYSHTRYFEFAKRLCNWPEIKREVRKQKNRKIYIQDIIWMKKLWDNPTIDATSR